MNEAKKKWAESVLHQEENLCDFHSLFCICSVAINTSYICLFGWLAGWLVVYFISNRINNSEPTWSVPHCVFVCACARIYITGFYCSYIFRCNRRYRQKHKKNFIFKISIYLKRKFCCARFFMVLKYFNGFSFFAIASSIVCCLSCCLMPCPLFLQPLQFTVTLCVWTYSMCHFC